MADGVFTISELAPVRPRPIVAANPVTGRFIAALTGTDNFAKFSWPTFGRGLPVRPWTHGTTMRMVRTDYPGGGNDNVTHQILGPNSKDFTLTGKWDDRYGGAGYATKTYEAFDAMVRRGNRVRMEFEQLSYVGYIKDAEYHHHRRWQIGYSFTFSPERPTHIPRDSGSKTARPLNVRDIADAHRAQFGKLQERHATAPASAMTGDKHRSVSDKLDRMAESFDKVDQIVKTKVLGPIENGAKMLLRISQEFLIIRSSVNELLDDLIGVRSNVSIAYQNALTVLDLNTWSRGLAAECRLLVLGTEGSRKEVESRVKPDAIALYRPHAGESPYAISRKFYGTPHNWRQIVARNHLSEAQLTGHELLVIPRAGA
jgi:hypothetical protein